MSCTVISTNSPNDVTIVICLLRQPVIGEKAIGLEQKHCSIAITAAHSARCRRP